MVEARLVVDRAAYGERQVETGRHPPRHHVRIDSGRRRARLVTDLDRVVVAVEVVVELPEFDLRHERVRLDSERARPHVGKWEMSRKLSVIRPADTRQVSTPVLIRRYAGSSSAAIVGMGITGWPPAHPHEAISLGHVIVVQMGGRETGLPSLDDGTNTSDHPAERPTVVRTRTHSCRGRPPSESGASR